MKTNEYILMCMDRVKNMLYASLQGLTIDQVCKKPESESNHIAWIVWHMTRGFDRRVSMMVSDDQIWILEKWYEQYNLPRSDKDLGIGHTSDDVNKIVPKNVGILLGYYESVNKRMLNFFLTNESENYQRILKGSGNLQGYEMMRMVAGTLQHVGQINYVRGLIETRILYGGDLHEKR